MAEKELAGILAAAVHAGWLPVQEGLLDVLDCIQISGLRPDISTSSAANPVGHDTKQWPRYVAEQYMDPEMPGGSCHLLQAVQAMCWPWAQCTVLYHDQELLIKSVPVRRRYAGLQLELSHAGKAKMFLETRSRGMTHVQPPSSSDHAATCAFVASSIRKVRGPIDIQ